MEETITSRFNKLERHLGIKTQVKAAERVGLDPSHYSRIKSGQIPLNADTRAAIKKGFPDLNLEWLEDGIGKMFVSMNESFAQEPAQQYLTRDKAALEVLTSLLQGGQRPAPKDAAKQAVAYTDELFKALR